MIKRSLQSTLAYLRAFAYWAVMAAAVGAVCGLAGGVFAMAVEEATVLRGEYSFLMYLMPAAGLIIAGLYRLLKLPLNLGTDEIITTVRTQGKVPLAMAPAIFISTVLTHLTGGSAGREGAALQLGGSIGVAMSRMSRGREDTCRIFELCGMAALFSALFGTPLTATVFVLEIIEVGRFNDRGLLPCLISAVTAKLVAMGIGAPLEAFPLAAGLVTVNALSAVQAAGLGVACAAVAIFFCVVMHFASKNVKRLIPNDFLRVLIGGAAVILLTLLLGTTDYNGGGMHTILHALQGHAAPEAFLLKILFTAVTLSSGYKGGEIVPSFFVGATMGCVIAPLMGFSAAAGAALGMIGVFCGVTNAPLASMMLSVELFGTEYLPLFGVTAAVSYMLSGHFSLYHAQIFAEPKMGHREEQKEHLAA